MRLLIILICFIHLVHSFNVLVYSPSFGGSHTKFLASLADILTQVGHRVTFLVPVADEKRRNQLGVKLTKDVIMVEHDEQMASSNVSVDDEMNLLWTKNVTPNSMREDFRFFADLMVDACANLYRNRGVIDELATRQFDVAIVEPLSVCGLGLIEFLGIDKTILASSCVYYDYIATIGGEEIDLSTVPSVLSPFGDEMSFYDRYYNYLYYKSLEEHFQRTFDREMQLYRRHLSPTLSHWDHLISSASIMFINSNPLLDFPRLVLPKTVAIGGISVNMNDLRRTKLDAHWDEVLGRREKTMLISFGSMASSSAMPIAWRDTILRVIQSMPNVTFVWKYESDDVEWAHGCENVVFDRWVPQPALLVDKRLTAFLTHGGLGSTNELAHAGKPAIVVPLFGDQKRNARMLTRHNGSIFLSKWNLDNFEILQNAFHEILNNPKYAQNADRIAKQLEMQPFQPREIFVKYTEFVAQFGPLKGMEPSSKRLNLNFIQRHLIDVQLYLWLPQIVIIFFALIASRIILAKVVIKKKTD